MSHHFLPTSLDGKLFDQERLGWKWLQPPCKFTVFAVTLELPSALEKPPHELNIAMFVCVTLISCQLMIKKRCHWLEEHLDVQHCRARHLLRGRSSHRFRGRRGDLAIHNIFPTRFPVLTQQMLLELHNVKSSISAPYISVHPQVCRNVSFSSSFTPDNTEMIVYLMRSKNKTKYIICLWKYLI